MTGHLRARHRAVRTQRQDGLSLVEVMIALLMLSIVSISASVLFVSSLKTTTEQSVKQRGIAVATRSLETLAAVPVAQLVKGRSQAAVQALLADPKIAALTGQDLPGPQIDPTTTLGTYDPSTDATSVPVVPIYGTETLNGTTYNVTTVINQCLLRAGSGGPSICDGTADPTAKRVYRATVNVTWGKADCGSRCSYSVSSLIDQRADPRFQLANSVPIIQAVAPSSTMKGSTRRIVITGADLRDGATLELAAGGGTLSNVLQPIATAATTITATWTAGLTVGPFTLTVVNPDGSRANFSLGVVAVSAVDACTATPDNVGGDGWRSFFIRVSPNSGVSSAGTTYSGLTGMTGFSAGPQDASGIRYSGPNGKYIDFYNTYRDFVYIWTNTDGVFTTDYTATFNGVPSTATLTFRANSGPCT